jgi:integrase
LVARIHDGVNRDLSRRRSDDKDPEWRNEAVFTREVIETIISDARIPSDRQVVYALELLAGVRPGEAAALRWRHYDPMIRPLGKLLVAKSYNTRKNREKSTKTDAVKHVPVHPVLVAMLAEWKLGGWTCRDDPRASSG